MSTPLNVNGPMPSLNCRVILPKRRPIPARPTDLTVHKVAENIVVQPKRNSPLPTEVVLRSEHTGKKEAYN